MAPSTRRGPQAQSQGRHQGPAPGTLGRHRRRRSSRDQGHAGLQHPTSWAHRLRRGDGLLYYVMPSSPASRSATACSREAASIDDALGSRRSGVRARLRSPPGRRPPRHQAREHPPAGRVALVADFGIALASSRRWLAHDPDRHVLGTPAYMSPEQAMASRSRCPQPRLRARAMTYEMLTANPRSPGSTRRPSSPSVTETPPPLRPRRPTVKSRRRACVLTHSRNCPPIASAPRRTSPMPSTARKAPPTPHGLDTRHAPFAPFAPFPPCPPCLIRRDRTHRRNRGLGRFSGQEAMPAPRDAFQLLPSPGTQIAFPVAASPPTSPSHPMASVLYPQAVGPEAATGCSISGPRPAEREALPGTEGASSPDSRPMAGGSFGAPTESPEDRGRRDLARHALPDRRWRGGGLTWLSIATSCSARRTSPHAGCGACRPEGGTPRYSRSSTATRAPPALAPVGGQWPARVLQQHQASNLDLTIGWSQRDGKAKC